MATQVLNTRFQLKRGLAQAWNKNNPVLAAGEPGWTLDTHVLKIGDGVTAWNDLESIGGGVINENDIQNAVNQYLEEHPVNVTTDVTLQKAGQPADAAAVRQMCIINEDEVILFGGKSTN